MIRFLYNGNNSFDAMHDLCKYSLFYIIWHLLPSLAGSDPLECYSCMSAIYESSMEILSHNVIYNKQKVFTDSCNDANLINHDMPKLTCSSTCVIVVENIGWGAGGYGIIRGCYDSVIRNGFNPLGLVGRMRFYDYCGTFNLSNVMVKFPLNWPDSTIKVCSCRGRLCNKVDRLAVNMILTILTVWLTIFHVIR